MHIRTLETRVIQIIPHSRHYHYIQFQLLRFHHTPTPRGNIFQGDDNSNHDILYMFPRAKAYKHIRARVREVVRSIPSNEPLPAVMRKLNPVLIGWCTYFRVGNSNRAFHKIDRAVRDEVHIWLRRKHRCAWNEARTRWNYQVLHEQYRLYRMVGKVTHLDGLRRKRPEEDGRRAGCGKTARPVR